MVLYCLEITVPFVWIAGCAAAGIFPWWTLLVLVTLIPAAGNVRIMAHYNGSGTGSISRLDELTAKLQLMFSLFLATSFALAGALS